ncbi:inner-membrane translocator [Coriobacterium glomerans PW2]|uniref:Inner-membrane translocator n=1 Tax=Coriobacterium glomerans (strain ATCC 49209 / DSM 20642 / JCM 10262 / PW2) TaxID=700015 RepID=F2NA84_CORGP|nr:branched-chain amino acid ABC transporter permease [Coriobacterium glomerans]AEB06478.1 inner-membrane translocator [Coriobacterium glomerans PW2]
MEAIAKLRRSPWFGTGFLVVVTVLCWVVFKIARPETFGSPDQVMTYLQSAIIYAVGGCGLYFIVVMGLWDFSIGSVLVLSCLLSIGAAQSFGYPGLVVAPILCGALLGIFNGLAYTKLRIPSLIVTVGLSLIYESWSVFAADWAGTRLPAAYNMFGSYPANVILAIVACALCGFILKYTKMGTYATAIGSGELTAKNMGVNVDLYKFFAFVLCSTFVGIMAVLYIGYGTAQTPMTGMLSQSLNFTPLMGTFFGIAFRKYGHPVIAIVIGEFIISMLFAGFIALGMPTTVNNVVTGLTLLVIVVLTVKRVRGAVVK